MSNESWIDKLTLHNFRCHPNVEIDNFKRFNLVYGRNGSGKTSILEAIEIALTGSSSRIEGGVSLKDVCARDKSDRFSIKISMGGQEFSSFESSLSPAPTVILKSLFNIEASSQKARYLLPQMFLTHNLLYAEKIVQFLCADTQKDIEEVLAELTVGRDVMDKWKTLLEGKKVAASALKASELQEEELQAEIDDVEDRIKLVSEVLNPNLTEQIQLYNGIVASAELSSSLILPVSSDVEKNHKTVIVLEGKISHGLKVANEVLFLQGSLPLNYKNMQYHEIESILTEQEEQIKFLGEKSHSLSIVNDKEETLVGLVGRVTRKYRNRKEQVYNHKAEVEKVIRYVDSIIEWFPEISASINSQVLYKEAASFKDTRQKLQKILNELGCLPNINDVQKDLDEEVSLQKRIDAETEVLSNIRKQISEHVTVCERKRHEISLSKNTEIERCRELVNVLAKLVDIAMECDSLDCPTCGHTWPDNDTLVASILARKEQSFDQIEKAEGDISLIKEVLEVESVISNLSAQERVSAEALQFLEEQKNQINQRTSKYGFLVSNIKSNLVADGYVYEVQDNTVMGTISDFLRMRDELLIQIQNIDVQTSTVERKLNGLWTGLRSEKYEAVRNDLRMYYNEVNSSPLSLNAQLSFDGDKSCWNLFSSKLINHLEKVNSLINSLEQRINKYVTRVASLENNVSKKREDINKLTIQINAIKETNSLLINYFQKYKELNNNELLGKSVIDLPKQVAVFESLEKQITIIRITVSDCIRSMKEFDQLKQHHLSKIKQKEQIRFKNKTLRNNVERFTKLLDPKDVEAKIWNEYITNITSIFTRLHWPPDFKNVNFSLENNALSIKVLPKGHTSDVAASNRLSAGQRAALALSIFWSMNVMTENVPNVMLMDEPIQNVDDLNVLNFLDGLRTLIENRNYQVFLTTANSKICALVRKKFSYLGDDFLEMKVSRFGKVSSFDCFDGFGNSTSKYNEAVAK